MEKSILALIPAYNESTRIETVVVRSSIHLPVLVVDDGSTDSTAKIAEKAGASVLVLHPNKGKGAALKAGFGFALDAGADAVITLDADGQHDPAEIPKFLRAYREHGADLVIGARQFYQMPPIRRLANWLGKKSFSWAIGQTIPDNQSGYRLISRHLMQRMLQSPEEGFEFEVDMIVSCLKWGYPLDWVPIRTIYAGESSHINPIRHLLNYTRLILKTRRELQGAVPGSPSIDQEI